MDRLVLPLGMLVLTLVCIGLLLLPFALHILETRRTPLRWLVVLLVQCGGNSPLVYRLPLPC